MGRSTPNVCRMNQTTEPITAFGDAVTAEHLSCTFAVALEYPSLSLMGFLGAESQVSALQAQKCAQTLGGSLGSGVEPAP